MDQEDSCEVKRASLESLASDPSLDTSDSSSLSEEEGSLSLSPLCNQYNNKMRIDSSLCDCVLVSDEEIIESMHQNLMRIIISLQIRGVDVGSETWSFEEDGCKTPPSRLSGTNMVPDTCPGAPMKLTKIVRNIDSGLRRKLF